MAAPSGCLQPAGEKATLALYFPQHLLRIAFNKTNLEGRAAALPTINAANGCCDHAFEPRLQAGSVELQLAGLAADAAPWPRC